MPLQLLGGKDMDEVLAQARLINPNYNTVQLQQGGLKYDLHFNNNGKKKKWKKTHRNKAFKYKLLTILRYLQYK